MESVTRFWSYEAQNIRCVREADFDRVTAEREALQLMLNKLEEQVHSLEQRRYAEQQAREAAERRVEELKGLLRRISKHYENSDVRETNRAIDEIEAALNPTAEAASHE